tara:strand:+ start:331 stop:555 length:225 start_codon:yes stop_codon:yes gene_type:complete
MTLLDRLKPEFRKQLDEHEVEFPTTVEFLKEDMINNTSFIFISVDSALTLLRLTNDMPLSFENLENLFNEYKFN